MFTFGSTTLDEITDSFFVLLGFPSFPGSFSSLTHLQLNFGWLEVRRPLFGFQTFKVNTLTADY